jgi:hypothetical protein
MVRAVRFRAVAGRWFCTLVRGKIVFSYPIFFTSTVERTGQAVRGGMRIAGGYGTLRSSTVYWLGYGERPRAGPRCNPILLPLLPLSPTPQETLAAAMALHIVHHCYRPSSRLASREMAASIPV